MKSIRWINFISKKMARVNSNQRDNPPDRDRNLREIILCREIDGGLLREPTLVSLQQEGVASLKAKAGMSVDPPSSPGACLVDYAPSFSFKINWMVS